MYQRKFRTLYFCNMEVNFSMASAYDAALCLNIYLKKHIKSCRGKTRTSTHLWSHLDSQIKTVHWLT